MLAIYDAQDNALQAGTSSELDQADLYERLLGRFAEREVLKADRSYSDLEAEALVEEELFRLSMVAFAAFNRGRQGVTEADLDSALPILLDTGPARPETSTTTRRKLTVGQTVLGRFFFIHEARARREDQPLRTYKFLHATFGEYLIARALERELSDLAETALAQDRRSRATRTDDNFLHALLSFATISQRRTTLDFLTQLLAEWEQRRRSLIRTILLDLFQGAMEPREHNHLTEYAPASLSVPARHATYSANLVLLLIASNTRVSSDDLFPTRTTQLTPGAAPPNSGGRSFAPMNGADWSALWESSERGLANVAS
jgi:hypothetical protein